MEHATERLIVVSTDSHAGVPNELWAEYLPAEYHSLLPKLHDDNQVYSTVIRLLTERLMVRPEYTEAHKIDGFRGLYDPEIRVREMDREGIAAEMVYLGDFRLGDMFHNIQNDRYPLDAWQAGARLEPLRVRRVRVRHRPLPPRRRDRPVHRHGRGARRPRLDGRARLHRRLRRGVPALRRSASALRRVLGAVLRAHRRARVAARSACRTRLGAGRVLRDVPQHVRLRGRGCAAPTISTSSSPIPKRGGRACSGPASSSPTSSRGDPCGS